MKKLRLLLVLPLLVLLPSCLTGKQIAKSVIDIALATCIAENADISDEAALREVCRWTDELAPTVKDLLSARRKGVAKAAAACGPAAPDGKK